MIWLCIKGSVHTPLLWPPDLHQTAECRIFTAGASIHRSLYLFNYCSTHTHGTGDYVFVDAIHIRYCNLTWQYESKKKSSQVSACSVGWRSLLCSIRVAFDGKYWMERPAFYLWDRKNKSKKGKKRMRETDSSGERELGVRVREARELRERSWQELPLGPVPVFQRKCRRPNLWPPEMGDLVAPAYCPVYHLLLLMGLSSYWTGTPHEKEPQETKRAAQREF